MAADQIPRGLRAMGPGPASLLLFCALSLVYILLLQKQPYGDGITYLDYLLDGKLAYHHLLYLPTLWLFSQLGTLLGLTVRSSAFAWSAISVAGAMAILYYLLRTAHTFRFQFGRPLLLILLLATSPSVLFYATQLENHANHLLWVCLFFLALDRALASLALAPWILAGLALTGAYASHSSFLLLFPALFLLVRVFWTGRILRKPEAPEIRRLLLLFVPTLLFKYLLEPWIKAAQGDPNLALDFGLQFALSLMGPRSLGWLSSYLVKEVFFSAFGLWSLFALSQLGKQERRAPAHCMLLGLLCYYLFFAHWLVLERGAYFLPLLPFAVLTMGSPQGILRRFATPLLLALILAQATLGYSALRQHDKSDGPWKTAAAIADLVPQDTVVLCRSGLVQLHLKRDQGIAAHPLENWMIGWTYGATQIKNYWPRLIQTEILPKLDASLAKHPLYLTQAGSEVLSADPGAKTVLDALKKRYRFEPQGKGVSTGWFLLKRN